MKPREPMSIYQGMLAFPAMMLAGGTFLKLLLLPAEYLWLNFWNSPRMFDAFITSIIGYFLFLLVVFALALIVLGLIGIATTIAGKPHALLETLTKLGGHTKRKE